MTPVGIADRPRLAARARLKWDEREKRHVLLFPEAALVLNATAAETLKLCDGIRTVGAIIDELCARFGEQNRAAIAEHVPELLGRIRERGLVET
jgi:pyrroloquinoline quinone biosynthesis protein D